MLNTLKRLRARKIEKGEEGFTLIELLIVIVVLGILAAVVVFSLGGVTKNADQSACQADYSTLNTAVVAYTANTGSPIAAATTAVHSGTAALVGPNLYLQSWPTATKFAFTIGTGGAIFFTDTATGHTTAAAYAVGTNDCTSVL
jgi:prepilin-type N-terminal cleavage/methylation domain-containing protein